ncbi:MAG: Pseudouridine synthase [Microgenomates group bacterium Gr01-1014_80]|nr:MAG: Pseudouridine synthase [Microgenomates group bacterium Gr01-1014_80]
MSQPQIIFEDEWLLVLDKPPGLVVAPSETQKEETLVDWLSGYLGDSGLDRMGVVHRLDKDTSGLILVAKTQEAFENLQAQFKERVVKKEYIALVHGHIDNAGKVEGAVGRNPGDREKFTVLEGGKEAVTEYEPKNKFKVQSEKLKVIFEDFNKIQMRKLERMEYGEFTMVRCKPLTGRTHQIRVHLKYIGHPIVSDEKYAGRKMYRLDRRWCPRQFLHAWKIGFKHPVSGQWMELESPLPEDLIKALSNLNIKNQISK